jgi:glycosyltransferase involved in cell wall biosynthesis
MVILHLLAPAQVGGLERVVHSLAIGQQRQGHQVVVAAILEAEGDAESFFHPLERAGVSVQRIVVRQRAYLREHGEVRSLVRAMAPDVVHSHGYRPDVIDGGVIRHMGVATVATVHGYTGGAWRNRLYESIHRHALRWFDAVIAVSEPLGKRLRQSGVPDGRVHVVPNAFMQIVEPLDRTTARAELNLPAREFVVGWVGRMIAEKGLDVVIDAFAALPEHGVVLCAIGAGPDRPPQEEKADRLRLTKRIRWAGMVAEAARYFTAFDVYVISSRTEGLPISLFEAMASGIPVVTTRVGGIPRAVTNDHALLVEPENPSQLAAAIRDVYANPDAARERAQRAQERLASEFGMDAWLGHHDEVYADAIRLRSLAR